MKRILFAVALFVAACGGTQTSRSTTIVSLDTGVRSAEAALRTYERQKADEAIAAAASLDDGKAELTALRARTAPAWKALDAAISALDAANTLNDDPSLAGAKAAIDAAIEAVANLTGGKL
ncbi:MAG TPA: hypothetical protein VFQ42_22235 [Mycobacterium sp.]|nr:hypothetical protein [Mycobacterium sp.]